MLKIPSKLSVLLSIVLSVLLFLFCIAGAVIMPEVTDTLIHIVWTNVTSGARLYLIVLVYMALAAVMFADVLLFSLLLRVRGGLVFTPASVAHIRGVSWCCMFLCAVFCGIGIYFKLAFVVAFGALFLGLCLRVVKNVIEEATEIKSENDLTV